MIQSVASPYKNITDAAKKSTSISGSLWSKRTHFRVWTVSKKNTQPFFGRKKNFAVEGAESLFEPYKVTQVRSSTVYQLYSWTGDIIHKDYLLFLKKAYFNLVAQITPTFAPYQPQIWILSKAWQNQCQLSALVSGGYWPLRLMSDEDKWLQVEEPSSLL